MRKLPMSYPPPRFTRVLLLLVLALEFVSPMRPAAAADSFVIIVNAANPVSTLQLQEVSDLFLKKVTAWQDRTMAAPVNLVESSPTRESFSQRVHLKGTAAIKSYWQRLIFSGRGVPPPEKPSPAEVSAFVSANRGAIGYVPAGTPLGPGVKVVALAP